MKPLTGLLAAIAALISFSCIVPSEPSHSLSESQLQERAKTLRMYSAALREDAEDHARLIARTEQKSKPHRLRLETLRQRKEEIKSRLAEVRAKMAAVGSEKAKTYRVTLDRLGDDLRVTKALIGKQRSAIASLQHQLKQQRGIREGYLQRAADLAQEAKKLEMSAEQREGGGEPAA